MAKPRKLPARSVRSADETRALLAAIVDSCQDAIYSGDMAGIILTWNAGAERLFGFTAEEMIGQPVALLFPEGHDAELEELKGAVRAGEGIPHREATRRRKDGATIPVAVTISPIRTAEGTIVGASVIARDITDSKRAERALRESEERFRRLTMATFEGIAISDGGKLVDVNQQFASMLGYEVVELIGRPVAELVAPEDRDRVLEQIRSASTGRYEHVAVRKDGTRLTVEVQGRTIPLEGRRLRVTAVSDMTARKRAAEALRTTETERERANEALRKSEEKFAKVFVSLPVGIVISDLDTGLLVDVNEEFLKLLGYRREEIIGHTSVDLALWPDPRAREALVRRLRSSGAWHDIEQALRAKDGRIVTVRAGAQTLELDGATMMLSAFIDVTDRRRMEAELRQSEQLYRDLVDGARDVIVAMTADGVLTALNPAFEKVTGMPRAQWIGQSFVGLLVPEDVPRGLNLFQAVLRQEPLPVTQLRVRAAQGRIVIAEFSLSAQRDGQRVVAVRGVARDVTVRAQLEAENRQFQKMESVGQLAGGLAHDFNNILMVIQAAAEFLLADLAPDDRRRVDALEIADAAQRAAQLTRQLLAFSRRQVLELRVLDLNTEVRALEPMLRRLLEANIDLSLHLGADLPPIKGDQSQLEQVVLNLVVNARDAMPDGGTLVVTTTSVSGAGESSRSHAGAWGDPGVVLSVADTGVGMDAQTRSRIFEPFFTTKPVGHGTGLGLATVYGVVQQLGGDIRVASEVGRGTTFKIYFPGCAGPLQKAIPVVPTQRGASPGSVRILLVEDDPSVRGVVRQTLERGDFLVTEAADGEEALDQLRKAPDSVDLVLSDIIMPNLTGFELRERLRDMGAMVPVLLMSGYPDETFGRMNKVDEMGSHIKKPFTADELARKIGQLLQLDDTGR